MGISALIIEVPPSCRDDSFRANVITILTCHMSPRRVSAQVLGDDHPHDYHNVCFVLSQLACTYFTTYWKNYTTSNSRWTVRPTVDHGFDRQIPLPLHCLSYAAETDLNISKAF